MAKERFFKTGRGREWLKNRAVVEWSLAATDRPDSSRDHPLLEDD